MMELFLKFVKVFEEERNDYIDEPPHDKTNKMVGVPIKDSDQPGQLPSLISHHCPHEERLGP